MRHAFPFLAAFSLALACSGCVKALGMSGSIPVQLRVTCSQPQHYSVRVKRGEPAANYPVGTNGAVVFSVPLYRGCSTYLCGVKVGDGSGKGERVVELRRGERVVRTLSLRQIAKLPTDETGYKLVKIGD